MGTFYKRAKWSMKNALAIFYRKVRIEGMDKIPRDKPLLIVSNHQNALLDPLLVGSFFPFPIHFLTRADVFNKRSRPYLKKLNMMPIYRIRDGFKSLSANDAVFEKCKEVFGKAESIMIFPEGNHGKHHYLRPLTKGAARLALSSQLAIQKELLILPVGVNYFDHRTPRSTVFIKYGEPFAVQSFLEEYEENNAKGLQVLRDRMSEEMKKLLIVPEKREDYEDLKNAVFQEKNRNLSFDQLRSIKVGDGVKVHRKNKRIMARLLNPLPYYLISKQLGKTKDIVFYATTKFAIGLFLFPIWWLLVFAILSISTSIPIAFLAVAVAVSGLFISYNR